MFESVAPETYTPRSRKVFYETLPVSIVFHVAAIGSVLVANHWNVSFPDHSPKMTQMYSIVSAPTPPPPPPPPPGPTQAQQQPTPIAAPPKTEMVLAPTVIPDVIPVVMPETIVPVETPIISDGVPGGVEGGVAGGVGGGGPVDGVVGGEAGGVKDGVIGSVGTTPPDTVVVERDKPLPMLAMSQVYPKYPEEARIKNWEDELIVRYVVGKNGRVREVTVLDQPDRAMFADATVKAIKHWRFRPLVENGEAKEVVHEMTVYFKLDLQYSN